MYTGIVQALVQVAWVEPSSTLMRYALSVPSELQTGLQSGASIAVLGVCQTVVAINGNEIIFEAIEETLKCTTLSSLHKGQWVNFERSAKMGDEIGGHPLAGHVLGTATIKSIDYPSAEQRTLRIACDPKWMKNIFPKGFIALNGASLTVGETDPQGFLTVHLIPETLKRTTFGAALVGDQINVEIDSQTQAIVATVERILAEKLAFSN